MQIFADSKFLREGALIELVKAVMWAAGPVARIAAAGEDSATAEVSCRYLQAGRDYLLPIVLMASLFLNNL